MGKLIVGLGNPGREYEETRHNIGFMLVDHLPLARGAIWKEKYKGEYAKVNFKDEEVHLLKPMTYMNLSGESVQKLAHFFKIEAKDIIVIHDELDIPYGSIVLKFGGGLAGLTLARQLAIERPQTRVLVVEAAAHPVPSATHKVGESCVEVAGTWLRDTLQLSDHLDACHLPKLGLRFFLPAGEDGGKSDIAARVGLQTAPLE